MIKGIYFRSYPNFTIMIIGLRCYTLLVSLNIINKTGCQNGYLSLFPLFQNINNQVNEILKLWLIISFLEICFRIEVAHNTV